ncbi:hypothetical protein [Pseudomonas fragi]|uniref:hypothetical protein n=1 Tax=Pseudomonas fragi TaxID=296 RepID=UPI001475BB98|nr:hypothetical protein [Pseudomonas fragi]NNB33999.1 hypothetical protein [Pseudomonas fragi]
MNIAQAKENALAALRSEIIMLTEQTKNSERLAFHNRAQGFLMGIASTGLLTSDEILALGHDIGVAHTQASRQCQAATL